MVSQARNLDWLLSPPPAGSFIKVAERRPLAQAGACISSKVEGVPQLCFGVPRMRGLPSMTTTTVSQDARSTKTARRRPVPEVGE